MVQALATQLFGRLGVEDVPYEGIGDSVPDTILWGAPPNHVRHWWNGQRSVIFSMWETGVIPATFRGTLDAYDMVIVPSLQNLEMFSEYHPNVRYCPLGVDPVTWPLRDRKESPVFTFFSMANSPRKGNDLLTKAFRAVFGKGDDKVQLVVCDPRIHIRERPGVRPIHGYVSDAELHALYDNAHCYLAPSRGEGFGLQPLQAMSQGIPTILTNAHGQAQFAHLGIGIPAGLSQSYGFVHGDAGDWWEPDFDALCGAMRDVYNHYDEHLAWARLQSERVRAEWNWDGPGEILLNTLGDLSGPMLTKNGEFTPPQRTYLLRVKQATKCMIGGVNFVFKPGVDYDEVSDVKRVIYDAGLLDPSCIDIREPGFSHAQVAA